MVLPLILTCGPNEVIVLSGLGYQKSAMITGGRIIAFPCLQRWHRMSLNVMTLKVASSGVYTAQGVPITVTGVAQVKISTQHPEILERACEHFLKKSQAEIEVLITATLEGHQRAILGAMTVEDIYKNRKLFNSRVFEVASKDLCNLGLHVLSYTIRDLSDEVGYLEALGMSRTAEVQRDARIGEVFAQQESRIQKSLANEELMKVKYANDSLIAQANRDFQQQKAIYDQEVMAKKAEADLAYELQSCKTKQKIQEEKMEIVVVERQAKIHVQEQEIQRTEKLLDATVKQPAEAEKYRLEIIAEAQRKKTVLEAEGQAESKHLKGEAEAFAIEAKAKAEAATMHYRAEAFKQFKDAAILDLYLKAMPQIVGSVGSALSNAKSIKMVSSGGSEVGAQKLTQEVMDISTSIPEMVKNMTGVDLRKSVRAA
ncbi:flotillin-1-like [Penaeus japonicus]|uniref:flotillin-1-like n=1 Tax=Penaeus japonicus TaxID=27405 RepID=UPI001C70E8AE|nr:flotillin-1-like [Penaeus japonicus]